MAQPDALSLKWSPIPVRPWQILRADGSLFRGFASAEAAQGWLERHGYQIDYDKLRTAAQR